MDHLLIRFQLLALFLFFTIEGCVDVLFYCQDDLWIIGEIINGLLFIHAVEEINKKEEVVLS